MWLLLHDVWKESPEWVLLICMHYPRNQRSCMTYEQNLLETIPPLCKERWWTTRNWSEREVKWQENVIWGNQFMKHCCKKTMTRRRLNNICFGKTKKLTNCTSVRTILMNWSLMIVVMTRGFWFWKTSHVVRVIVVAEMVTMLASDMGMNATICTMILTMWVQAQNVESTMPQHGSKPERAKQ